MSIQDTVPATAQNFNDAFISKTDNVSKDGNLALNAALSFPKVVVSTSGTINALASSKVNIKLTGSTVVLNGATAGSDGQVLIIQNSTGSDLTINSLSGSASAANQFQLSAGSVSITSNSCVIFQYDSTAAKWYQISYIPPASTSSVSVSTKTTTYSITTSDSVILCDATSAAFTVTLPTASGNTGKTFTIKKIDSSSNIVTIATTSSQTIDGVTTQKLFARYDTSIVQSDGSNWVIINRRIAKSQVRLNTSNGRGSTNTKIRRYLNVTDNYGTAITYADSATLGMSCTINEDGIYAITVGNGSQTNTTCAGISLNSTELTTDIYSITVADRLAHGGSQIGGGGTLAAGSVGQCSWTGWLVSGDVIRSHDIAYTPSTSHSFFTITKVSG